MAPRCEPKKARAYGKGIEANGNKVSSLTYQENILKQS